MALDVRWVLVLLVVASFFYYAVKLKFIPSVSVKISKIHVLGLRCKERPEEETVSAFSQN